MADVKFVLWHYSPSLIAAIVLAVLFLIGTVIHLIYRIRRAATFANCMIVGGIFETAGYGCRAYAHFNTTATIPYAIQSLLILLGPILFAASVYMFLARVILASGAEHLSPLPATRIAKIFVLGDVTCFIVQAAGGGILSAAKSQNTLDIGNWVILAGLVLQIIIFFGFIATITSFHIRFSGYSSEKKVASPDVSNKTLKQIYFLYTASVLITARNIYRVLEFGLGQEGYLIKHEWTLIAFDGALMVMVLLISNYWYF
ncbi:RTA1-like protein 12 [Elsinoe fawcettii]|nr:RTA1-like protein 12 [Elsinoe fawcettii]